MEILSFQMAIGTLYTACLILHNSSDMGKNQYNNFMKKYLQTDTSVLSKTLQDIVKGNICKRSTLYATIEKYNTKKIHVC